MKSAVAKIILFLLLVSMLMSWLLLTQSGLNWVYQRAKIYLPDGLIVAAPQGRLMGPMTLHNVAYQQPEAYIKTGEIVVDWHLTALLTGSIDITQLQVQGLQIVLPETETQPTTSAPNQTSDLPEINLPWRVSLAALQISEIDIKYGEQQLQLQQITLNASTLFNRINIKQLAIRGDNFLFNISGELQTSGSYRHQLDTDWQFTLPTHVAINGRGQVRGDLKQIQINQQLTGPLQLTLNAQLNDVLHKINWHANVDVSAFNAAQLLANLPALSGQLKLQAAGDLASANVTGKLTGEHPDTGVINADFQLTKNADNTIHIEQLALQLPAHRTLLKAHGQWLPDANGGAIKLALDWKKLRWPMQGTPWFDSASGHGTIDGTLNHYAITLATESPWPEAAPSYWHASAEGDLDGMTFHNLRVNALDGAAVVTGQIKWAPTFSWQANVHASDINPAQRWPDWPGKLQAQLRTQGHMKNDAIVADVDIEKLTGELRGYPVSLRSQFQWHDAGIDFAQFDFHSATALVSASGRVGEISNLDWDISAANLAEIYPLAQGEFTASGRLAGQWDAPLVEATLQGKAIVIPDYKIGTIDGRLKLDLLHWRQIDIHLAAQALNLNGYPLQSLDLTADSQQLQAHIVSALANLQLEVNGAVAADGWQGTLTRADIQSTQFTDWQLQAPVALNFNANSLQLNSLCWRNPQQASVCTGLTWQDSWWKSQIKLTQFPLQVFSLWLPPDLKLEGTADASAELQLKLPDQLHGNVRIDLTPGAVSYPVQEGERAHWAYASGLLTLLLDEHGLQASTEIDLQNGDALRLNASLPGARVLALSPQQSLHGEVAFKLHDLGLFEVLVPEIQDLKGEVAVNLPHPAPWGSRGSAARPV